MSDHLVFISYAWADAREFARQLAADLEQRGGHRVWLDQEDIEKGGLWDVRIEQGIHAASVVLAVTTPASVREQSVCRAEVLFALLENRTVVPLRAHPQVRLPLLLTQRNGIDFTAGYEEGLAAVLRFLTGDASALRPPRLPTVTGEAPLDFGPEIARHSAGFTGRQWLAQELDTWLSEKKQRALVIVGESGVGKSAIAAWLCLARPEVVGIHFCTQQNTRTLDPHAFVASLVGQLHVGLPGFAAVVEGRQPAVRRDRAADAFRELIVQPTRSLPAPPQPHLLVVDSLDEAVSRDGETVVDVLVEQVPDLPAWLRVVTTTRPDARVLDRIRTLSVFELHADRAEHQADVRAYIDRRLQTPALAARPEELLPGLPVSVARTLVAKRLEELAAGNFEYARGVLDDLEDSEEELTWDDLGKMRPGLVNRYLQDFQRRFRDPESYQRTHAPLLRVMAVAREPLCFALLRKVMSEEPEVVRRRLRDLSGYCRMTRRGESETYALSHKSRVDWLTDPDKAGDYWCPTEKGHARLAEVLLPRWWGEAYALRHLVAHLLAAEKTDESARLLLGPDYVEAKTEAGLVFELADEIVAVFKELPDGDYRRPLLALLEAQGQSAKPLMARMAIQCFTAIAKHDPAGVSKVLVRMVEPPTRTRSPASWHFDGLAVVVRMVKRLIHGRDAAAAQANIQAARVALEVAVATSLLDSMKEAVRWILLTACAAADSNVRSLAVVAVFRLARIDYSLAMSVLQELVRRSVWFGLPRLRRIGVFAGCAAGLFFERFQDERLIQDLKQMTRDLAARVWWLKLALWLIPKGVAALWTTVPDDYNDINLAELKRHKKYVGKHPEVVKAAEDMIEYIDPGHGTSAEFCQAMIRFAKNPGPPEAHLCLFPYQSASISRALTGDEAVLEAIYESRNCLPRGHMWRTEFLFRLRVLQVGRKLLDQPALGQIWSARVEDAIREFLYEYHGVFHGVHVYLLACTIPGVVFLADQFGDGHLPFLKELIDWASAGEAGMQRWPETPERKLQPDSLLLRLLEVVAIDYGVFDRLSRQTAFFGISCFLQHAAKFDEFLRDRLATILARMSVYMADEVAQFLGEVPSAQRQELTMQMHRILPQEGVGTLLAMPERLYAWVLAEPPGKKDGLRREWQWFLRTFLGPRSVSGTLQDTAQRVLQLVRRDSAAPSK